jgi:hypothetical protein
MEKQLFTWESWDQHDTSCFGFSKVKLKVDIGNHKAGEMIPYANIDYEKGELELYLDDECKQSEKYRLYFRLDLIDGRPVLNDHPA